MSSPSDNQTKIFLEKEADGWFERNFKSETKKNQEKDMALEFLLSIDLSDKSILEVGCADGWRLGRLQQAGCHKCFGIEPSKKAVEAGKSRFPGINLLVGSADSLPYESLKFDVVVAGFCLYLCDRTELFRIAMEFDRVLKDGGIVVITDFISSIPYKNEYSHSPGVYSYKMDYSTLFTWNPFYSIVYQRNVNMNDLSIICDDTDNQITLTVIRKRSEGSYPLKPGF